MKFLARSLFLAVAFITASTQVASVSDAAIVTLKTADTTNVTKFPNDASWLMQTGTNYSTQHYYRNDNSATAYIQWRFQGLTSGVPHSVGETSKESASNRSTVTKFVALDSDGTTVLATRYVNQRYITDAFTYDGATWRGLFNVTPTGTTLYVRMYAENGGTADYVIGDGIYVQQFADGIGAATPFSINDGNFDSQSTWFSGVVPSTSTAAANIYTTVNVTTNTVVGNSGASSTSSINVRRDTGKLIVNDGVTLTVRGGILLTQAQIAAARTPNYYPLQVGQGLTGGAILEFDATLSSGAASVYRIVQSATNQPNAISRVLGVSGNPSVVRSKSGGANASFSRAAFTTVCGQVYADYANFVRLGSATVPAIDCILSGTLGATLRLSNCSFDTCGNNTVTASVSAAATGVTLTINDSYFENIVTSGSIPGALFVGGTGTGTFNIRRNWFDGYVNLNFQSSYASLSLEDNVYLKLGTYNNATTSPAIDRGHLWFKDGIIDNNQISTVSGVMSDSYLLNDFTGGTNGNPHFLISSGTSLTLDGVIWHYIGGHVADVGDALDNSLTTTMIKNSIVLPSTDSPVVSSGTIWQFSAAAGILSLEHNTIFCSNTTLSGLKLAHSATPGVANQVPSVKSNLFWATGSGVSAIRCDETSTVASNFIAPTGIMNNDLYGVGIFTDNNIAGVGAQSIRGMSGLKMSANPAAQLNENPQFVDSTRNILKWARDIRGKSGTDLQVRQAAMLDIKADRTLTRTSLIPYVRAGFAPTNAALDGTGHDGADVGAVPVTLAPSATIELTGPTTGEVGKDSTDFTISVVGTVSSPVTFSISRPNTVVTPNSRTIGSNSSATFKIKPSDYGDGTITVTNDAAFSVISAQYNAKIQAGVSIIGTPTTGMDWGGWLPNATGHLSILNQDVTALPKDPRSDAIMAFWGTTYGTSKKINFDQLNQLYGRSYSIVTNDTPMVAVKVGIYKADSDCDQITGIGYAPLLDNPGIGGNATVPTAPAPGDCHAIAFNRDTKKCYVLYDAWRDAGTNEWNCASFHVWDFSKGGGGYEVGSTPPQLPSATSMRRMGHTSETTAGLPLLPLTLRYDEAIRGPIQHCIRITTGTAGNSPNFVWPGRHYASGGSLQGLPFGAKLRLRQDWYEANKHLFGETGAGSSCIPANILWTFRNRGVISTDHTASSVHFQIETALNTGWSSYPGLEALLETIPATGEAWEVVEMTRGVSVSANRTSGYPGEPVTVTATYNPAALGDDNFGASWYFSTTNGATIRTLNVTQNNTNIDPAHPGNVSVWTPQVSDIGTHQLTIRDNAGNLKSDSITYTVLNPQLDGGFKPGVNSGFTKNPLIKSKIIK